MAFTISNHWVDQARRVLSPNYDERPDPSDISLLVIHGISLPPGEFGGGWIDDLFCNRLDPDAHPFFAAIARNPVSSHFLVRRDGELVQYVACDQRAWHAGRSCWGGREECNDFSIGIELEGTDELPYTDAQYDCLEALVAALRRHYPRLQENLAGHQHVAPGRKTDPGPGFDWARLAMNPPEGKETT